MPSRDVIDLTLKCWMGFDHQDGDNYYFKVYICRYLEVEGESLIQLGASWIADSPGVPKVDTIFQLVPWMIEENDQFPYANGSGIYYVPEDLKIDYVSGASRCNPTDFSAESIITWDFPDFFSATVVYVPVTELRSPVPEAISGYEDKIPIGDGGLFIPTKANYWLDDEILAYVHSLSPEYGRGYFWGAFAYEGVDLNYQHVWVLEPTTTEYYTEIPYRERAPFGSVLDALSSNRGYTFWYEHLSGYPDILKTYVWKDNSKPIIYYPREWPDVDGGTGIIPVVGAVIIGALAGLSLTTIWPFDILIINSINLEINGNELEIKK